MVTGLEKFTSLHTLYGFSFPRKGLCLQSGVKLILICGRYTARRRAINFENSCIATLTGRLIRLRLTIIHHGLPAGFSKTKKDSEMAQVKEEDGALTKRSCKASMKTAKKRIKTANVDKMQIDSGSVAPLITIPNVPSGLLVKSVFFWVV